MVTIKSAETVQLDRRTGIITSAEHDTWDQESLDTSTDIGVVLCLLGWAPYNHLIFEPQSGLTALAELEPFAGHECTSGRGFDAPGQDRK